MDILNQAYVFADAFLIWFYRLPGEPVSGFYFGTLVLALLCLVLGEATSALVYRVNRGHYENQNSEMVRMHNLSVKAALAKDKESFKASNLWANEYFGKAFFAGAALFAVSIWPLPFALGWLGARFADVGIPVPLTGLAAGHASVFIGMYVVLRVGLSRVKKRLPVFQKAAPGSDQGEELISWSDVAGRADQPGAGE